MQRQAGARKAGRPPPSRSSSAVLVAGAAQADAADGLPPRRRSEPAAARALDLGEGGAAVRRRSHCPGWRTEPSTLPQIRCGAVHTGGLFRFRVSQRSPPARSGVRRLLCHACCCNPSLCFLLSRLQNCCCARARSSPLKRGYGAARGGQRLPE